MKSLALFDTASVAAAPFVSSGRACSGFKISECLQRCRLGLFDAVEECLFWMRRQIRDLRIISTVLKGNEILNFDSIGWLDTLVTLQLQPFDLAFDLFKAAVSFKIQCMYVSVVYTV